MRKSMNRTGRGAVCAAVSLALSAALSSAVAAPAPRETSQIPFQERYHVTQHGGIARAANSSVTCGAEVARPAAAGPAAAPPAAGSPAAGGQPAVAAPAVAGAATPCASAQQGYNGANGQYRMAYIDTDTDPNTYNSSSADLRMPAGSRVSYARLYWGGNLRAGEQKPAKDNGRVLIAEPGGMYKQVLADTVTGHRTTPTTDGFQASADVTKLVRASGPGAYTVAQINVASGQSTAGTWGGWTLVVAYQNPTEPLRKLALWDGFQQLDPNGPPLAVKLRRMRIPAQASGLAGVVAYNGDRGTGNDSLSVAAGRNQPQLLTDAANPANDVMNSTITDFGQETFRQPAYRNTLGFDSDVFDITPALRSGGNRLSFRFGPGNAEYLVGALFVQADSRR
ncbi:DUF3344 domain-containing protein [Streptomyces piniterrae]|uniref:DUF3344 domain-containing protein n=1 Tax=Streptomyces piniterrae TaxID=2571125 RepID=A0A4U0NPV1_9ACTN|nr:DUF3344 domain-containing protein [Streptomyces piniterrae]TJZ55942.1 DUF3344 domain-containing protein [Streptomyces piniterrae]